MRLVEVLHAVPVVLLPQATVAHGTVQGHRDDGVAVAAVVVVAAATAAVAVAVTPVVVVVAVVAAVAAGACCFPDNNGTLALLNP